MVEVEYFNSKSVLINFIARILDKNECIISVTVNSLKNETNMNTNQKLN